ncbi:uncharacterized protein LOC119111707 [Pollicipes pollicipes]|uniref:uncharacterized protein LOC119111707 n=1 Tax=Pollicipes pollicipes TaxID=41117 RepID=UPI001884A857|nr:uncharacterized protein LOC119111707 [Pollicipes pollicipes]
MDRNECLMSAMVVFPLFFSHVVLRARGDDRPEHSGSPSYNGSKGSHYVGDHCLSTCSAILQHAFCNTTSHRCECSREYPVVIDNLICEEARHLGDLCRYDKVCTFSDLNSECRAGPDHLSPVCRCRVHYEPTPFQSGSTRMYCVKDPLSELLEPDTPTVVGLLAGLALMSCLICLVLRLFYRARHARARGYGDASLPPPLSLTVA